MKNVTVSDVLESLRARRAQMDEVIKSLEEIVTPTLGARVMRASPRPPKVSRNRRKPRKRKTCALRTCNKRFLASRSDQEYHSDACRSAAVRLRKKGLPA